MSDAAAIVEEHFDLAEAGKVTLRIFPPAPDAGTTWGCRIQLGSPFDIDRVIYGEGSLQALSLALKHVAATLYGTSPWRDGKLGLDGDYGGFLGLPAPTSYLDFAPFPF